MPNQGPNDPTAVDQSNPALIAWTNDTGVFANGGLFASASLDETDQVSQHLEATGFGFSIPQAAHDIGITVEARIRSGIGTIGASIRDHVIELLGGPTSSDDKKTGDDWPTSFAYKTWGSSTDNWGFSWHPNVINSASFGVGITAIIVYGGALPSWALDARIDHIRVTVDYSFKGARHFQVGKVVA